MKQEELNSILELHRKWLYAEKGGKRADLSCANLSCANLSCADLRDANLRCANLRGADLSCANLRGADLSCADLRDANLRGADLSCANLRCANLSCVDLRGAKNIHDLYVAQLSIVPEEGSFIGWKKAYYWNHSCVECIIKLEIPSDAKRSNATGRKCRASKARVIEIQDLEGNRLDGSITVFSNWDEHFIYLPGTVVEPTKPFDEDRWSECASGIHFYITRIEAVHH